MKRKSRTTEHGSHGKEHGKKRTVLSQGCGNYPLTESIENRNRTETAEEEQSRLLVQTCRSSLIRFESFGDHFDPEFQGKVFAVRAAEVDAEFVVVALVQNLNVK